MKVDDGAIDYINIRRIEELCLQLFGRIPHTSATEALKAMGVINEYGFFQQRYVQENLSRGTYLFDYVNAGETSHYRELTVCIGKEIEFADLNTAVDSGRRQVAALEGHYTFFVGGVYSQRPTFVSPGLKRPQSARFCSWLF